MILTKAATTTNVSCPRCKLPLKLKVIESTALVASKPYYFYGYECEKCGPHCRMSDMFLTRRQADLALEQAQSVNGKGV